MSPSSLNPAMRPFIAIAGIFFLLLIAACGANSASNPISAAPTATALAAEATPTLAANPTNTPVTPPTTTVPPTYSPVPTAPPPTNTPVTPPTATPGPGPTPTAAPTKTAVPTATRPPSPTPIVSPTPGKTPIATATSRPTKFAYLYSRIDYPLEIPVDGQDQVTLLLATNAGILSVTPVAGKGNGQAVAPIPLPTDLEHYRDVAASVDIVSDGTSPIVWQLTSAPRLSLLTGPLGSVGRTYQDTRFTWTVRATAPGQNRIKITLGLAFVYANGQEANGTIDVSASPIPIVAVASTPFDALLRQFKLPAASLAGLGAFLGIARFIYGLFEKVNTVSTTVKDAATIAQEARKRLRPPPDPLPPTLPRHR